MSCTNNVISRSICTTCTYTLFFVCLRFPVPNLQNMKQPPWYRSSLRNEVLFASISDVGLSSLLSPPALAGEATYSIDAYFNNAKGKTTCTCTCTFKHTNVVIFHMQYHTCTCTCTCSVETAILLHLIL